MVGWNLKRVSKEGMRIEPQVYRRCRLKLEIVGEIFERIEKEFVEFEVIWHKINTKNRYSQALRGQL